MIRVKNRKTIANISKKSLKANKTRNIIAILAIALTTILFTALFTIALTMVKSFEQQTFRQVGGDVHGTFKDVTEEEIQELIQDPMIKDYGVRWMLGMPYDIPFNKAHVEVSYMDESCAKGFFCTPEKGRLPKENTDEIACDTRILKLLGVEPEIGEKITLSYSLGFNSERKVVTDEFTLCGWWTYDEASMASHAIVPRSYAAEVLQEYEYADSDSITGKWSLNIYLKNSSHIEKDMETILDNHGYQTTDPQGENYIATGVNWAYMGAQLSNNMDASTMLALVAMLLLIVFTGYLIIYNIFQISVSNDIRFYGLLKTIGTTAKQIQTIILHQALYLSIVGIPIGLICGYLLGNVLTPVIMSNMTYKHTEKTMNPWIFIGATLFSLITVFISCRKPGKVAGKVSPVEAVRYTENTGIKKTIRKKKEKGSNLLSMAFANLSRNKKKTVLVVLSLSLAVVLLQITVIFTNGFDMDKYLRYWVVSDFIVANADYFQTGRLGFYEDSAVSEETIEIVGQNCEITEAGRIYGNTGSIQEVVTPEYYRKFLKERFGYSKEATEQALAREEQTEDGNIYTRAQFYGMEKFPLDQLNVIEGDLAPLYDPEQNAIAAVYNTNDYDEVTNDYQWEKVGDEVRIRYVDEWEYIDTRTGEPVLDLENAEGRYIQGRVVKSHEVVYTVAACITVRTSMTYRYFGADEFILNSEVFKRDSNSASVLTYLFDTAEADVESTEQFLKDYTQNVDATLDYESKQEYVDEFNSLRSMFLVLGGALSSIIGFVGVLNFFNAVITSIMTRRREFAMLESIGMTGKQLNIMLIMEGLLYAVFAAVLSLVLGILGGPVMNKAMSSMFWFFSYCFTLVPILIVTPIFLLLGIIIPSVAYHTASKQTVVERLREAE